VLLLDGGVTRSKESDYLAVADLALADWTEVPTAWSEFESTNFRVCHRQVLRLF